MRNVSIIVDATITQKYVLMYIFSCTYITLEKVLNLFFYCSIADIPMSVGIIDPRANPTQLNTVEFLWDPSKRTSVFIQVFDRQQLPLHFPKLDSTLDFSI